MAKTATILNGASQSNTIQVAESVRIVGLVMPAAWTAAAITLLGSLDGQNFLPVHDAAGTEVTYVVDANRIVDLTNQRRNSLRFFRLRSGTTALPVVQLGDRAITVLEESLNESP